MASISHGFISRTIPDAARPVWPAGATGPDLAAGCSEIEANRLVRVRRHRLALDGPPGIRSGEPLVLSRPTLSAILRDIHCRLAARTHARPYGRAVHREHPHGIRVSRM